MDERIAKLSDDLAFVFDELLEVFWTRHETYGFSPYEELDIAIFLKHKVARLLNMLMNPDAYNEKVVKDSWIDIGNYAFIAMLVRKGQWGD